MVLSLLYGLGARDYADHLGYVIEECSACGTTGLFAMFQTKRKVTFYTIPTISVREQQVVECGTCHARFSVPPARREEFAQRLMTREQVIARYGQPRPGGSGALPDGRGNGRAAGPTYYQILQVDPAADPEVIEAAFRRLALKYHPDRSAVPDAADRMRELLEAKACLTDPDRRRVYDASLGIAPRRPRPAAMRPEDV